MVWAVIFTFIIAFAVGFIAALLLIKNTNIVTVKNSELGTTQMTRQKRAENSHNTKLSVEEINADYEEAVEKYDKESKEKTENVFHPS